MLDHSSLALLDDEDLLQSLKAVAARASQITATLLARAPPTKPALTTKRVSPTKPALTTK